MSFFHIDESIGNPIWAVNRRTDLYLYQDYDIDLIRSSDMGTLGSRLSACRAESGYTQKEVCARTGIKQGPLSELENDKYPTSSFVPHLAELYGVEALWLAEGRGKKTRSLSNLQPAPPSSPSPSPPCAGFFSP